MFRPPSLKELGGFGPPRKTPPLLFLPYHSLMNAAPNSPHVLVVGGGAAGFFAAITLAEANPDVRVTILERSTEPLGKVRISGGGRCNVTHDQPDPAVFAGSYPRGSRALRGPLTRFGAADTASWFAARGVELKTEPDGRMFPVSNSSETVVNCLLNAAHAAGVTLRTRCAVRSLRVMDGRFEADLGGETLIADRVLLATGSNPQVYAWAAALGHEVAAPVPSLFTFKIDDPRLAGLAGVSVPDAEVTLTDASKAAKGLTQRGPLLVTHWGLSGPAVLKLSAWGARDLHEQGYRVDLRVNWLPDLSAETLRGRLLAQKTAEPRKQVAAHAAFGLPGRLWAALTVAAGVGEKRWADVSKADLGALEGELGRGRFAVSGKGVFKDEFVTCGGVKLTEVDFRTLASRRCPGLYFAGELLDVDGVTGGFNFQSAWATGYLAGRALAEETYSSGRGEEAVTPV